MSSFIKDIIILRYIILLLLLLQLSQHKTIEERRA